MFAKDRSLAVRFIFWWIIALGMVITLCAVAFYVFERHRQWNLLKKETFTLAAVVAPRVEHDLQNHVAGYAYRTLRSVQTTEKSFSLGIYGKDGALLFSTHPAFKRIREVPWQVKRVLADGQSREIHLSSNDRYQVFYPLRGRQGVVGVLRITRSTRDLFLIPMFRTAALVMACIFVAVLASGYPLLFLRTHYFKPLKELNNMLEAVNKPMLISAPLEIPPGAFHGELASLYRNAGQLAKRLQQAKRKAQASHPAGKENS